MHDINQMWAALECQVGGELGLAVARRVADQVGAGTVHRRFGHPADGGFDLFDGSRRKNVAAGNILTPAANILAGTRQMVDDHTGFAMFATFLHDDHIGAREKYLANASGWQRSRNALSAQRPGPLIDCWARVLKEKLASARLTFCSVRMPIICAETLISEPMASGLSSGEPTFTAMITSALQVARTSLIGRFSTRPPSTSLRPS